MTDETLLKPCGCGSCEDAFKAALRLFDQSVRAGDCVVWRLRVFSMLEAMAGLESSYHHFKDNGFEGQMALMSPRDLEQYAKTHPKEAAQIAIMHVIGKEADDALIDAMLNFSGSKSVYRQNMIDVFESQYVAEEVTKAH